LLQYQPARELGENEGGRKEEEEEEEEMITFPLSVLDTISDARRPLVRRWPGLTLGPKEYAETNRGGRDCQKLFPFFSLSFYFFLLLQKERK
jgi:hypothetical protein